MKQQKTLLAAALLASAVLIGTAEAGVSSVVARGSAGKIGPAGPAGKPGPAGPAGPQGLKGDTGSTGAQGPIGLTGATGAAGTNGVDGAIGPKGVDGAVGPKGDTGLQGVKGDAGINGVDGVIGPKGDTGLQGPIGLIGLTGATGPVSGSCTLYHWGDTGPDGGKVFYVDGSGCHGLEAQATDASSGAIMDWETAISAVAAYNTTAITGVLGLNCSTTAYPSSTAPPATPNCWHLPSKTELEYLYEQKNVVGGFSPYGYWSSSEAGNYSWAQNYLYGLQDFFERGPKFLARAVRAF